jgi:lysozyme-like protein
VTLYKVTLKPGPVRAAAALALAGFNIHLSYPTRTDGCGKVWTNPSALLIATSIAGAETSGEAWVFHGNQDEFKSVDYGLMQVNDHYSPAYFAAQADAWQLNWAKYQDNAKMAYQIWSDAHKARTAANGSPDTDWKGWNSFNSGHYLRERYAGRSWLDWAHYGVSSMTTRLNAGETLESIASIDLDPLTYWQE